MNTEPYVVAQRAIAELKGAIYALLKAAPAAQMSNAEIGRTLGIYMGHVGHQGHISRTLLEMMSAEEVVEQDAHSKLWRLRTHKGVKDPTGPPARPETSA